MGDNPDRLYRLDGVVHIAGVVNEEELLGVLPPLACIDKFTVRCSWMQETFGEIPDGADDATIQRYARAYIMMLLGTQLFGDKSGTHLHIRWLPYVAKLEDMGGYSWGSAALSWLYRPAGYDTVRWPLASRWSGYNPTASERGPWVTHWRLRIDLLQAGDFTWMPYSTPEVVQVVHPEILEPRHMVLWRSLTSLIYFVVIEWHQVDRVLPQFGGVQPFPQSALNIDFLMAKDGRGSDRLSHDFLDWWAQHGQRFLSPELLLGDPRAVPIPAEALQRGPGRVPDMDRVDDVLDRRRGGRRRPAGGRGGQDDDDGGDHGGGDGRGDHVSTDGGDAGGMPGGVGGQEHGTRGRGSLGGDWYGSGAGEDAGKGPSGGTRGAFGDYFEDEAARQRQSTTGPQSHPAIDLNAPPSGMPHELFALGGTPPSTHLVGPQVVTRPSGPPPQTEGESSRPPTLVVQEEEAAGDGADEDELPVADRPRRVRRARCSFTGLHLFR
ncbi:hypothetical protein Ahy_B01g053651 [Arachis hypogaea]|uniref:Aminotransferase-like plant mobile domain-containing protein n=1 Tax=Arachis hypogaea TaxID=3818 RepID=A0A445AS94_ARAHY|nr:hypothetical protein Ahy_B01g053651 [Arachis hypogaea]